MLILTQTTDTIQVVLGGTVTTNQLPTIASYRDITTSAYTPGRNVVNTNNTTDVEIVPAPAASTQRVVDFISIYNNDTANAVVTVKYDLNGTDYILFRATIQPSEAIQYQEGMGFYVVAASSGAQKSQYIGGISPVTSSINRVILGSDVINNNAVANTIQDITGLSFAVNSGSLYWFRMLCMYTSAATTTGSRWSVNGPAAPTLLMYSSRYSLTTTSVTSIEGSSAYDLPAASNGTSAATGANIAMVEGFIQPSANGTLIGRFASEVTSSAITAKAGSFIDYQLII